MSKFWQKLTSTIKSWKTGHKVFVGSDPKGNRYYIGKDPHNGREYRMAEQPDGDIVDTTTIPAEWHSWLHHTRELPPSEELQQQLAKYRKNVQKNVKEWEEEQERDEVQSHISDRSQSTSSSSSGPPTFDYVVKRLNSKDDSSQPSNLNVQKNNPLVPDPRLARNTSGRASTNIKDPSSFTSKNTSHMTSDEVRDEMKKFSNARTSPFLGVKPQIRTNIQENAERMRQEEKYMRDPKLRKEFDKMQKKKQ
jgi:NADH:ubiquinone oxidoreductase subunit